MRVPVFCRIPTLLIGVFCLLSLPAFTQPAVATKVVTGVISDASGTPLSNATVKMKDGKTATTTDANGAFRITIPASTNTLLVSYVGMRPQEVAIDNRSTLLVSLTTIDSKLNEVVVVGYGTKRRSEVTSSIASISEKDIKNLPVAGIDQALQGKLAGVIVTSNGGQPGGGVSVRIRGITTINGNEPLYVIDGVPILTNTSSVAHDVLGGGGGQTEHSVLATLNPNDIASIDVLKDASAQAIYGSLAANGVVIINTKRGKAGEGKISYDMYYGWQEVPQRVDMMNLQQYAKFRNEIGVEVGQPAQQEFANPDILGNGTNWQDGIFQVGRIQNHQISFSGGRDKTTHYLSFNYFNQTGTVIGSEFERFAVRFNLDNQLKSWFRAGISANASTTDQKITLTNEHDGIVSIALLMTPAIAIKNPDGSWGGRTEIGGANYGENYNPVALALLRDVRSAQSKVFGNLYGEILFNKHFTLRNEFSYDFQLTENRAFQPTYKMGNVSVDINRLREDRNTNFYWAFRSYLNFNKNFAGRHDVSATVGHEASSWRWNNVVGERVNLATDNIVALNTGSAQGQNTGGGKGDGAMESYFARASYTLDNKYAISASIRRDGSSAFGPNNRHGYFPAVSAGWTVTNERFADNWKGIDYLKIRVGAGAVGNQQVGQTAAYITKVRIVATPFGPGGIPANVGNPDLKWESAVTYNAGIDATILNRRIEVSLDVYKKVTTDMLMQVVLPSYTGLGTAFNDIQSPAVNAGKMTNNGIDLSITSFNIQKKDLTWKTQLVFSHYKNELVKLNDSSAVITGTVAFGTRVVTRTVAGQPVGQFYGFVTDGLFRTLAELNAAIYQGLPITQNGTYLGDIRYKNIDFTKVNGAEIINDQDVTFIGNPHPKFTFGFTNTVTYKSFDASIFLHGSIGAKILNYTRTQTEGLQGVWRNQTTAALDRYTATNTEGSLPRFNVWHQNNVRVSDRWVENGSYVRIQNIALGYNLPTRWVNKAKLANVRVYVSAQNIHTFTKYSGYDPELGATNRDIRFMNIDNGSYPNPRTFTVGVNVEL
jgi:TonB-dependent starch-binding outer membrane protein SusC